MHAQHLCAILKRQRVQHGRALALVVVARYPSLPKLRLGELGQISFHFCIFFELKKACFENSVVVLSKTRQESSDKKKHGHGNGAAWSLVVVVVVFLVFFFLFLLFFISVPPPPPPPLSLPLSLEGNLGPCYWVSSR